jgi:hypothetical protein
VSATGVHNDYFKTFASEQVHTILSNDDRIQLSVAKKYTFGNEIMQFLYAGGGEVC